MRFSTSSKSNDQNDFMAKDGTIGPVMNCEQYKDEGTYCSIKPFKWSAAVLKVFS